MKKKLSIDDIVDWAENSSKQENARELTPLDYEIINKILLNPEITKKQMAKDLNRNINTICEHMKKADFQAELKKKMDSKNEDAISLMREALPVAIKTLIEIMTDKLSSDSAKVSACRGIIDKALPNKIENLIKGDLGVNDKTKPQTFGQFISKAGKEEQQVLADAVKGLFCKGN